MFVHVAYTIVFHMFELEKKALDVFGSAISPLFLAKPKRKIHS